MKFSSILLAILLTTYSSLSFSGNLAANLVWKDKGIVKQKVSLADCKKQSDNGLNLVKEYRLFEIDSKAFWDYLKKTENQFATIRLPLPDGNTTVVKLDKNSPIQSEYPEVSRSFLGRFYKPNNGYVSGSIHELNSPPQPLHNIIFEVTLENTETTVGDHYSIYIYPLKKPNTYAVSNSRNTFACPRPPLPRR
jgi:hypothetical protein